VDKAITKAAAPNFKLDQAFAGTVTGNVYASPLYVQKGPAGKGTFYVATEEDTVYALDETTGAEVWHKQVDTRADQTGVCGNIAPIGITGTPAIDLGSRLMVLDAVHADSGGNLGTHIIYGLSIDDGSVKWSVDVSTLSDPGTGLQFGPIAQAQNERGAVLIVNGIAYVVFGGHYGDCASGGGYYHGWVVGVPLSGTGAKAWATQVGGAGIWGVGGAASDGQSIFVTTGNAEGSSSTTWAESEGLFRLDPGPSFTQQAADYFAPYNWQDLDNGDVDLSGSGPLVVDAPGFTPSKLVVAQGKDGYLYLVDRTNMGGIATMGQLANVGAMQVSGGEISNGGAWATAGGTTYIVVRPNGTDGGVNCPNGTSGDLVAVKLDASAPQKMSMAWCANSGGNGSPIITTSDGNSDALVWVLGAEGSGQLLALDLATGNTVYGGGMDAVNNVRHFTTPIAANGKVLVAGDGKLYSWHP
jgi:outer membrane protein assembly factor BamB